MSYKSVPVEWRTVVGFDDYAVSNDGRVRRIKPWKQYPAAHELKLSQNIDGYSCVTLYKRQHPCDLRVNRLVLLAFVGPPPSDGHVAAHNDGVKSNNHINNLRWATYSQNEEDKVRHGSRNDQYGEIHHGAILTSHLVGQLRRERLAGASYVELALKYSLHTLTVYDAVRGVTWNHITEPPPVGKVNKTKTARAK